MIKNPSLCEPGMKSFLKGSLKECRKFRDNHSTLLFSIFCTVLFICFVGGFLWYRYKGKLSPAEEAEKRRKTHSYLISKLQQYSAMRNKKNLITDLPTWDKNMV